MLPHCGSASGDEYGPIQPGLVNTYFVDAMPPTGARQGARSEVWFFKIVGKQHSMAPFLGQSERTDPHRCDQNWCDQTSQHRIWRMGLRSAYLQ